MMLTLLTFIFSTALALVHAATTDDACVRACGSYSTVLGYCDGLYGARAAETNYTYANAFVGCLCEGHEMTLLLGNGSALADYGICESCASTPHVIVADLSQLLALCTVQAVNGSAANATLFMPVATSLAQAEPRESGA
ncbi:hypothetical protein Q5752_003753 [Cryptotrichosporon argae]